MRQIKISEDELIALKKIVDEVGGDVFSYSGRYMYGEKCLAVDIATHMLPFLFFHLGASDFNAFFENILEDTKTDSLGMGMVVYWPRISPPEEGVKCLNCGKPLTEDSAIPVNEDTEYVCKECDEGQNEVCN